MLTKKKKHCNPKHKHRNTDYIRKRCTTTQCWDLARWDLTGNNDTKSHVNLLFLCHCIPLYDSPPDYRPACIKLHVPHQITCSHKRIYICDANRSQHWSPNLLPYLQDTNTASPRTYEKRCGHEHVPETVCVKVFISPQLFVCFTRTAMSYKDPKLQLLFSLELVMRLTVMKR